MPCAESGPRVRLIALDLDGTTLTSERQIHARNAVAIARAVAAGVTVVLASGRIRPSIVPFARQLHLGPGPFICSNGAHVVASDGSDLWIDHLDQGAQNEIIDFALTEGLHLNGYTTDHMFYLHDSPWLDLYRTRARTIPTEQTSPEALRTRDLIKLMVIAEPGTIQALVRNGDARLPTQHIALTESEPEYLEFLPRSANKGAALERLANELAVGPEEVMAVGDYFNDVEMIQWARFGVAMGNAVAAVKAVAETVTGTNDEGGVADAIETILQ